MKALFVSIALGAGALLSLSAYADPPAGATALCKDGTYYTGTSHHGACKGHDGVKDWLDKSAATSDTAKSTSTTTDTAAKTTAKTTSDTKAKTTAAATTPAATAAPADATARCKDGTYYTGKTHRGACKGHQGVQDWLDTKASTSASTTSASTTSATTAPAQTRTAKPAPAAAAASTPAAAPAPATTTSAPTPTAASAAQTETKHTAPTPASQITAKPGGGPGLVWVNSSSKVYHCPGDEWYGKTKEGSYMSEAAAKAEGDHAAHGKECGTK